MFGLACYSESVRPEIEQVVELIQRKDSQSLEDALGLLQNTIFSFSMKVCGQREDAEDTMQEVLLKSVPKLPKFDNPRALMVWLYKVAKTRCLMNRRKSKFAPKEALSLEELMPDQQELEKLTGNGQPTPELSLMRIENAKRLRDAVQKLPPEYRLILVLHDMEELSDEDIADITGLRPGTVRVRLHRARLFVRKELAKQGRQSAPVATRKNVGTARCIHVNGIARKCSPSFLTISMMGWTMPSAQSWRNTWKDASPARLFLPASKKLYEPVVPHPMNLRTPTLPQASAAKCFPNTRS